MMQSTTEQTQAFVKVIGQHADAVDELADRVAWLADHVELIGFDMVTRQTGRMQADALELKAQALTLGRWIEVDGAERTAAHFRNEAGIALGASSTWHYGEGGLHYGIGYARVQAANDDGRYNSLEGARRVAASGLRVNAASLRCHAAGCRVTANLYRDKLEGKIRRVG